MGTVGVERSSVSLGGCLDIRIKLYVVLCKSVGRGLRRACFQVEEISVHLLIVGETLSHVVEDSLGELLSLGMGHIQAYPLGVETGFVHAYEAYGREVVGKGAEISLRIRIKSFIEELCYDLSLSVEGSCGDVHYMVKSLEELVLVLGEVCDPGHVDGNDAHGSCAFSGTEESAGLLSELTEVKTEPAAHGTHVGRLHVGVDVVGEIRSAVFGCHFEEELVVFGLAPVEVLGD